MKAISKEHLDELIRLTKKYYRTGDVDILAARSEVADKLSKSVRGDSLASTNFSDIAGAILGSFGLKRNATRRDVYDVFALLGYDVFFEDSSDENETD